MLRTLHPVMATPTVIYFLFIAWMVTKQSLAVAYMGLDPVGPISLATFGAVIVCSFWVRFAEGRRQAMGYLLVNLLATLLVYTDILYFRRFGDLVSVASLRFVGQVSAVADTVLSLLRPADIWLWADVLVLLPVVLWGAEERFRWLVPARRPVPYMMAALGVFLVVAAVVIDPVLSVQAQQIGPRMVARRMGMLNYHAVDAGSYIGRLTARLTPEEEALAEVKGWFSERKPSGEGPLSDLAGIAAGKNVIVLQVESLHAFTLGMKIRGQEVTPNLNRLAKESLAFTNFYAQTGQGVTSDADLLANCSLYPSRTGAVYYDFAKNDFRCMPEILREHGYQAVAMQGIKPDFWNLEQAYPQVGFQRYYSIGDFDATEKIGLGISDESFLRQATQKLKGLKEPYYAFVVTLTSHTPFNYEQIPRILDLGHLEGTVAAHYLHAVHYTDAAIGKFVEALREEGVLDDSVLLLYGDHTGVWRDDPGVAELLGVELDDEVEWTRLERQVPFLIRFPEAGVTGKWHRVAGQADIAPTLAGLLGLEPKDAFFMGRNLLNEPEGIVAFFNGSAVSDRHLYLETDEPEGLCYDQHTGNLAALSDCRDLANKAARDLRISRQIVERNLIPRLRSSVRQETGMPPNGAAPSPGEQ